MGLEERTGEDRRGEERRGEQREVLRETVTWTRCLHPMGHPTAHTGIDTTKFLSNCHAPVVAIRKKGGGRGGVT